MDFDPKRFDEYREGNRLEAKAANGGLPGSFWDTYSSFANSYGGCIICGAVERKDGSWKTTGLRNLPKLKKDFWDTIHNKTKVSLCLISERDVEEYMVGEDVVLAIKVPRATRYQKPVYINNDVFGSTFRRDHEGDYRCTEAEVKAMIRDSSEETPDERVLTRKPDFDQDTIKSYRIRYNARHEGSAWSKLNDTDFLVQIGALNDEGDSLKPTAAGLLMFGTELRITREYPEYFLDYREMLDPTIRWTDRIESSSGEWSGNLLDFFFQMERKLLRDIKKPFKVEGFTRIDETPVHKAIREALANCIANADFNFPRGIVILKNPDSITIENPGSIITGKPQMLKGGISEPRNKIIMKMFNLIRVGERAGSGVPDIFNVWETEGWDQPVVEEQYKPDRTILRLSFTSINEESDQKSAIETPKPAIETPKPAIDEKVAFESIKLAMQDLNYNEPTRKNMEKLYSSISANQVFGASDAKDILGCSDSTARAVIAKLRDEIKVIVAVKGQGKGKYRFINK